MVMATQNLLYKILLLWVGIFFLGFSLEASQAEREQNYHLESHHYVSSQERISLEAPQAQARRQKASFSLAWRLFLPYPPVDGYGQFPAGADNPPPVTRKLYLRLSTLLI